MFSITSSALLAIIKFITGQVGHSYALVADALESTTDVFSSLLVLFGLKYASRPADANHPYGHGRAEPLITFVVVAFLITAATVIAYESIQNIRVPHEPPKVFTLYVLAPIIIWKEISFRMVMKRSRETGSTSLKADAWHHRSDEVTSIAAFIGISIALWFGIESADDWAALFASGFIIYNSFLIFRPALGELMDEHLYDDLIAKIKVTGRAVDGVVEIEKCYIRKSGLSFFVDLHAEVDGNISVKEGHRIAHELKDHLLKELPEIADVLVHVEPAS